MAKGDQKVTQNTAPWPGQTPYLSDIFGRAQTAANQTPTTPYSGDFIARPNQTQLEALNEATLTAQSLPRNLGMSSIDLAQKSLAGDFLNPTSNPHFMSSVEAALDPVRRTYMNQIIPAIQSKSIAEGAYGGDRERLLQNEAGRGFAEEALKTTSKMAADAYDRERLYQQTAPELIKQGLGLQFAPTDYLGAVGAQGRGFTQDAIQNELLKIQEALQAPWRGLSEYSGIVQAGYPGSSSVTTQPGPTPLTSGIQGALGGASIGASLYDLLGKTGSQTPWLAIPGIAGALGGFFG